MTMSLALWLNSHADKTKPSAFHCSWCHTDDKLFLRGYFEKHEQCVLSQMHNEYEEWKKDVEEFFFKEGMWQNGFEAHALLKQFCQLTGKNYNAVLDEILDDVIMRDSVTMYCHENPDIQKPSSLMPDIWTLADDKMAVLFVFEYFFPKHETEPKKAACQKWMIEIDAQFLAPGKDTVDAHAILQQMCCFIGWKPWHYVDSMISEICVSTIFAELWKIQDDSSELAPRRSRRLEGKDPLAIFGPECIHP